MSPFLAKSSISEPALAGDKVDGANPAQTGIFGVIVCVTSTYFAPLSAVSYTDQRPSPSAACAVAPEATQAQSASARAAREKNVRDFLSNVMLEPSIPKPLIQLRERINVPPRRRRMRSAISNLWPGVYGAGKRDDPPRRTLHGQDGPQLPARGYRPRDHVP